MFFNVAGTLIFLAVFENVASSPDGGVDCRKFVFAPLCRGVAAKRDYPTPGRYKSPDYANEESIKHFLGSLNAVMDGVEQNEDENRTRAPTSKQSKLENLLKMFQREQSNRILRLLFESRRSNSEKDDFPEQDFENL